MPPSTPVRELILENIRTALVAISAGATYFATVKRVDRRDVDPSQSIESLVLVLLAPSDTPLDVTQLRGSATGIDEGWMNVVVRAWILREVASDTYANQVVHDVKKAVMTDPTRGGNAIDTLPAGVAVRTDEATEPRAALEVYFRVHYAVDFADPSAQR